MEKYQINKLLEAANEEFSKNGFRNANIENIAKSAGISIETINSEFGSKEELFKAVVNSGSEYLVDVFDNIIDSEEPAMMKFEKLLRTAIDFSIKFPNLIKLYNEITAEQDKDLVQIMAKELESISINSYIKLLDQIKNNGELPDDADTKFLAYCIDNLFLITQFSYIPGYFQERMKIYLGEDSIKNKDDYIKKMMDVISSSFRPTYN